MSQRNPIFPLIFTCVVLVTGALAPAFSVDSGTHWLIVDATPEARAPRTDQHAH